MREAIASVAARIGSGEHALDVRRLVTRHSIIKMMDLA